MGSLAFLHEDPQAGKKAVSEGIGTDVTGCSKNAVSVPARTKALFPLDGSARLKPMWSMLYRFLHKGVTKGSNGEREIEKAETETHRDKE